MKIDVESRLGPIDGLEIQKQVTHLATMNGLSLEAFKNEVQRMYSWSIFEEQLRQSLIENRFRAMLTQGLSVNDMEIQERLNSLEYQGQSVLIQLRAIRLSSDDPELSNKIHDIQKNLTNVSFENLVLKYLNIEEAETDIQKKGLLPPRPIDSFPVMIQDDLRSMKEGDIKGPFRLGKSVYFFKKERMEQQGPDPQKVDQIKQKLLREKEEAIVGERLDMLRKTYLVRIHRLPEGW